MLHKIYLIYKNLFLIYTTVKYLETYNLFERLRKGTTSLNLDFDEMKKLIRENCEEFSWYDTPIFRTVELPKGIYVIDPKLRKRKSRSNANFYTLLMDNSEKWKEYPKRSESLICSYGQAVWGGGHVFRVIPFDGSKWGVCATDDIWWSLIYGEKEYNLSPDRFCHMLAGLNEIYYGILYSGNLKSKSTFNLFDKIDNSKLISGKFVKLNDNNYNLFINKMKKIEKTLLTIDDLDLLTNNKDYGDYKNQSWYPAFKIYFEDYLKKGLTIIDFFNEVFDPEKNKFSLFQYKDLINQDITKREVWSDSKCILINTQFLDGDYLL